VRAGGGRGGSRTIVLVRVNSVVRTLEAVDVPEATFEEGADEAGEAVVHISHATSLVQ
jgi:hypothetical protein